MYPGLEVEDGGKPADEPVWERNLRLYHTLHGMGLYVKAVRLDPEVSHKMDSIIVATDTPKISLLRSDTGAVVNRPKVRREVE